MDERSDTWQTNKIYHDDGHEFRTHKIRVEVVRGPMEGHVASVSGPEVRIGSAKDCDIELKDPTVSRLHAILRIEGDQLRVLDAKSRNGTRVDGVRVRDAYARPDSLIGLGASTVRLKMLKEVVSLPLSCRTRFGGLLGESVAMRRVFALLERIAPTEARVLIEGETGTGKELAALAIHRESRRVNGPFVVFDCSSVSETLIESELFGHRRGCFTGATDNRVGRFEAAHEGTLFLDEIGELPIDLQKKLLRALEMRSITRIGENGPRHVDVRIVAATNRSLATEVDRGRFREDLYYRLSVVPVRLPPLRERVDDIPMLMRHFEKEWRERDPSRPHISAELCERIKQCSHPWPGNVRELRNKCEMMMSLGLDEPPWGVGEADEIALRSSPSLEVNLSVPLREGLTHVEAAFTRAYLERALEKTSYNVTRTARLAGVGRAFVQRTMRKLGIQKEDSVRQDDRFCDRDERAST